MSAVAIERRYCTFVVGGLHLGVPVDVVREVIRAQACTRVPLVPAVVGGLINLRGVIVTTIDMRRRFDLPPRPADQQSMNVVLRSDDDEGIVSIVVDEIRDVVDIDGLDLEPVPATAPAVCRELITGVYELDGSLLLILDTAKVHDINQNQIQGSVP